MSRSFDDLSTVVRSGLVGVHAPRIGVAVSGGGDSLALLFLMKSWADEAGVTLAAVTVDHGLRAASAEEARFVAGVCDRIGVEHTALSWGGYDGTGNLQAEARKARYALMAHWARDKGITHIALGHTADDQAETFLLRLARGSGVDGLSAMAPARDRDGVTWLRPLLGARRSDLREYLRDVGQDWVDDPSNDDDRFDRIRIRKAMAGLAELGLDVPVLTGTAERMALARDALAKMALDLAERALKIDAGDAVLDLEALDAAPEETRLRLLSACLCWVSSATYRPRLAPLRDAWSAAKAGRKATLHGGLFLPARGSLRITRELAAVADVTCTTNQLWDGRWRAIGPEIQGATLRVLGENGLAQCPDWRATGMPRDSLLAAPAIWNDTDLIAAPLAGLANGWRVELAQGRDQLNSLLLSH